jgi:hypothetical protein
VGGADLAIDASPGDDGTVGSCERSTHPPTGMAEQSDVLPATTASWRMAKVSLWGCRGM